MLICVLVVVPALSLMFILGDAVRVPSLTVNLYTKEENINWCERHGKNALAIIDTKSLKDVIVLRYRNVRTNFNNEKPRKIIPTAWNKRNVSINEIFPKLFFYLPFIYYTNKLYTQVLLHIFTLSLCIIPTEFIGLYFFHILSESLLQDFKDAYKTQHDNNSHKCNKLKTPFLL